MAHRIGFEQINQWVPQGNVAQVIPELNLNPGMPEVRGVRATKKSGGKELPAIRLMTDRGEIFTLIEGDMLGCDVEERNFWVGRGPNSQTDPIRKLLAARKLPQRILVYSDEDQDVSRDTHCWPEEHPFRKGASFKWSLNLLRDRIPSWRVGGGDILVMFTGVRRPYHIERIVVRSCAKKKKERAAEVISKILGILLLPSFEGDVIRAALNCEIILKAKACAEVLEEIRARRAEERRRREAERWEFVRAARMIDAVFSSGSRFVSFEHSGVVYLGMTGRDGDPLFTVRNGGNVTETVGLKTLIERGVLESWAMSQGFKG